jgi:Zn finger protein HypA/HybF involved in hydrogenase expression
MKSQKYSYSYIQAQAYCVKCKERRNMKGEQQVIMKNGQHALSWFCTICGTKMFRIGGDRTKVVKAKVTKKPTARVKATTKRK